MNDASLLKGKAYIDAILDLLQGKNENKPKNDIKYCCHEITKEKINELQDSLKE